MLVGDTLPNGAIVLDYVVQQLDADGDEWRDRGVILAFRPQCNNEPFAVWSYHVTEDGFVDTYCGTYGWSLPSAVERFTWRANQLRGDE